MGQLALTMFYLPRKCDQLFHRCILELVESEFKKKKKVSLDDSVETHSYDYKEKFKAQGTCSGHMNTIDSITKDPNIVYYFGAQDMRVSSCLNACP